jgi:hypothetical protein
MATLKVYTPKINLHPTHSKNHILVRAAAEKGLTGIRILKYPNKSAQYSRNGWYLECYEMQALHLGFEIKEAEKRITQISI